MSEIEYPRNLESEKYVLAGMASTDIQARETALQLLMPEDFYLKAHSLIFSAIKAMHNKGEGIDELTVRAKLEKRRQLESVGGADGLRDVLSWSLSSAIIKQHCHVILEAANRRRVIKASNEVLRSAQDPSIPFEVLRSQIQVLDIATASKGPNVAVLCPRFSEIERTETNWLWKEKIPLGRLTLLVGAAGDGKTFVMADLIARITRGMKMPDDTDGPPSGSALMLNLEDPASDTLRPRLEDAGADLDKVALLKGRIRGQGIEPISLNDIDIISQQVRSMKDCRFVVVDPIGSFIGGQTDSYKDNAVRAVLQPLATLAEDHDVAVVVVAHTRKAAASHADDTALGSRAFVGLARAVWHLRRDPMDEERRLLLAGKINNAKQSTGLAFSIVENEDGPVCAWESEPVQMNANDLIAQENMHTGAGREPNVAKSTKKETATIWLRNLLADGWLLAGEVFAFGAEAGIEKRTLQRARKNLGIVPRKSGFDEGGWIWELPDQDEIDG